MSENCGEIRADEPEKAALCYCGACRVVYALWMLGRAVLTANEITPLEMDDMALLAGMHDENQTTLRMFDIVSKALK